MYKFIDINTVERYKGGFIVTGTVPPYNSDTQYLKPQYTDGENITVNYVVMDIPVIEEEEE